MDLLLNDEEIDQLSKALFVSKDEVRIWCPRAGELHTKCFAFIGYLMEKLRAQNTIGVELTLCGSTAAKQMPSAYMAMAYSPDHIPIIDQVITNRGPAAAVAIAIIQGTAAH